MGSRLRREREVGVAESSSDCRALFRDSRSSICIPGSAASDSHFQGAFFTFFCNLTTLVHFFSSKPSYFFRVASSNESPMLKSSRRAAAELG